MMLRSLLSFPHAWEALLCGSLLLAAPMAVFGADTPHAKGLDGSWAPTKAEMAGQPMPENVLKLISLKLSNGNYDVLVGTNSDKGTYKLDPATKPKGMTVTGTEGPNKGKTFPAIYELEGETLKICYDLSGKERPAGFKTTPGTSLYLVTYTRVKP